MKTRNGFILLTLLGSFLIGGCDNAVESGYNEQIVVNAFLYANGPIDSIVLHRTTPLGSYYDDLDYAVDSAQVTVTVSSCRQRSGDAIICRQATLSFRVGKPTTFRSPLQTIRQAARIR